MNIEKSDIIITGAGAGFGRAMAIEFSKLGSKVYAIDISEPDLNGLAKDNPNIIPYKCDISNNKNVELTVENIFETQVENEKIALINNAGIMKNSPLINLLSRPDSKHDIDLYHKVININQHGTFYMTRSVAERMIIHRFKGVIINLSSIAAKGNIGQTAYSASKAAIEAMTVTWAKELGPFGIRSVAIAPGFINSKGAKDALEEKMLMKWIDKTPLKRTGTIDEVVATVKFSIENDFINGETIQINGGLII